MYNYKQKAALHVSIMHAHTSFHMILISFELFIGTFANTNEVMFNEA